MCLGCMCVSVGVRVCACWCGRGYWLVGVWVWLWVWAVMGEMRSAVIDEQKLGCVRGCVNSEIVSGCGVDECGGLGSGR